MKETKKIRIKVKKRKLKIKNILIFVFILILLISLVYYILHVRIKNIYITGNNIVSDKQIIEKAGIDTYPSYFLTLNYKIKNKILDNPYIKKVEIKKRPFKIYINIEEYKMLALYNDKIILENGKYANNEYNVFLLPIVINNIDSKIDDFSYYFSKVEDDVLYKISQIEYVPNEVDEDRYLLYMNDGNSVYITLTKIQKLNKYTSIVSKMEGKNGIIYLDSGDYIELK